MEDYHSEIINSIGQGIVMFLIIIFLSLVVLLMLKIVFKETFKEKRSFKIFIYFIFGVLVILILFVSVGKTISDVSYYFNIKETQGSIEKIQYSDEANKGSSQKSTVISIKNSDNKKQRFVLKHKQMPNVSENTNINVKYDSRKIPELKNSNVPTYYMESYITN